MSYETLDKYYVCGKHNNRLMFVFLRLPTICHDSFALCHDSFELCHDSFALYHDSFALCHDIFELQVRITL